MANPFQAADDLVRLAANGLTFGLADKAASALGEQNTAARTKAATDRAGGAGDVASAVGTLAGAGKALQGAKFALPAIKTVGRAALSKKGALAAVTGALALENYMHRTGLAAPAQAAITSPEDRVAHVATGVGSSLVGQGTLSPAAATVLQAAGAKQNFVPKAATSAPTGDSFSKLLQAVAAANGGKVSMHDIANLSDVAYKRAAAAPRPVGAKDTAGNQILGLADELFTQRMAQAQAAKAAGDLQTAQQLQDSAVKERMGYLQSILGANPFDIGAALNLPTPGTE